MDFVGGMAVVLLLSGHDENKVKTPKGHARQAVVATTRRGNRGPTRRVIGEYGQHRGEVAGGDG